MKNDHQIMADLEKIGFPKNDADSIRKIKKMTNQLVELGLKEDQSYKIILGIFPNSNNNPARRQKMIEVFRQSTLNGDKKSDYFDIKGKIERMETTLGRFGFSREKYLAAVQEKPVLLSVTAEKMEENVFAIDDKYGKYGLDGKKFLEHSLKHPDLSQYDFKTLDGKIQTLMDEFSKYQIELSDLMPAIRKQPQILTVKSEEVINKAHILLYQHRRKFWQVGNGEPETEVNALRCILKTRPMALNLSVKNLRMRRLYAMFKPQEETLALGTFLRGKKELQPMLENALVSKGRRSLVDRLYRQKFFEEKYRQS